MPNSSSPASDSIPRNANPQPLNRSTPQPPLDFWLRKNGTIAAARAESPLAGRTPAELVIMVQTRKLLQTLLRNKRLRISDDLRSAIQAALRSRARLAAPLIPLGPEQRLGWLDEAAELICSSPLTVPGDAEAFSSGRAYNLACRTVPTSQIVVGQTVAGMPEEILVSGSELLVTLRDNALRLHVFAHNTPPPDPRIHKSHPLETLLRHFIVPDVPDIATIFPSRFQKLKSQLAAL